MEPNSGLHVVHKATILSTSCEWLRRDIFLKIFYLRPAQTSTYLSERLVDILQTVFSSLAHIYAAVINMLETDLISLRLYLQHVNDSNINAASQPTSNPSWTHQHIKFAKH